MTTTAAQRLARVQQRLHQAATAAGRDPDTITLIGVAKTRSAEDVAAMAAAGLTDCGENYLQEALDKQAALAQLPLAWHFIGALQSNKTRAVAEHFDWVHTVDRGRILERLSAQRPSDRTPLNVCIQVNLDAEASKAGVLPDACAPLLERAAQLPGLQLQGLMALPAPRTEPQAQRASLRRLATLARDLEQRLGLALPVLSMGMSDDLEAAVAEGATHVRIGTALFGPRPSLQQGDRP